MRKDYAGKYQIGRRPTIERMASHNEESWADVELALEKAEGVLSFQELSRVVKNHKSGDKSAPHPYQFIIYCIKNGWLKPI